MAYLTDLSAAIYLPATSAWLRRLQLIPPLGGAPKVSVCIQVVTGWVLASPQWSVWLSHVNRGPVLPMVLRGIGDSLDCPVRGYRYVRSQGM